MSQRNARTQPTAFTHGGVPAKHISPLDELRRSVLACLLWEDNFYESGVSIGSRIATLAAEVKPEQLAALAVEARNEQHLRHVPLLLTRELAKRAGALDDPSLVAATLDAVIQRADELAEFVALYWEHGKTPLSKQVKRGLARAFTKFDGYQLAKYNRERAVTLRDVLFLVHAKPKDEYQAMLWKSLVDGTLPPPDTWEVGLSSGADKRETFERLLRENKLGYLALLRNLRNMATAGVDDSLIRNAILARKGADKVLPFRYVAAARAEPRFEMELDRALQAAIESAPKLPGETHVYVDVSGSMVYPLSAKSDLNRIDAAAALAAVIPAEKLRVFSFSDRVIEVPPRRGMAGVDAVIKSQRHSGTRLAEAVRAANQLSPDRVIFITDEQATDGRVPDPSAKRAYMVNVGTYRNGVGYGKWVHIDGFSERIIRYIAEYES